MTITTIDPALQFTRSDRMRKALKYAGIGVGELAERLEVSRNTVSRWINDETQPKWRDLKLFAQATGVELEWLDPEGCARRDLNPRPIGLEPVGPSERAYWAVAA